MNNLNSPGQPQVYNPGANVNPYLVPAMLWATMEEYFINKWKMKYSEARPQTKDDGRVITWRTFNRTGGRANGVAQRRGSTFDGYTLPTQSSDGNLLKRPMKFLQTQTIVYEFVLYAESNGILDILAWEFEEMMLQAIGEVQKQLPSFTMNFDQQTSDESLIRHQQDDVILKNLKYIAQVPIIYTQDWPALRLFVINTLIGRERVSADPVTRVDSNVNWYIPVENGYAAVGVVGVYLYTNNPANPYQALFENTDYFLQHDCNRTLYIKWNDEFGATPAIGQNFKVDFMQAVRLEYNQDFSKFPAQPPLFEIDDLT